MFPLRSGELKKWGNKNKKIYIEAFKISLLRFTVDMKDLIQEYVSNYFKTKE